jgi:cystathionine gamma-synthase
VPDDPKTPRLRRAVGEAQVGTKGVWAGEEEPLGEGTQVPIVQSIAFGHVDLDEWRAVALGLRPGHIYSRNTNPTVAVLEEKVRVLEGAEAAISFASGMAAISNTVFGLLRPGNRVVSVQDTYGGTNQLFREFLPAFRIEATLCEATSPEQIEAEIQRGCQLLYLETPTNPTLKILDIARLARVAHAAGAIVVTDNTLATPINQRPLESGSDLVVHSASKFLGGHADALGGIVCGGTGLIRRIFHYREITGAALDPFAAYLILRGLKTLELRVERQNASALAIARFLERQEAVAGVNYPGLESHSQHAVAKAQMPGGFGGVLSFTLNGGYDRVKAFLAKLRFAHCAANLGAVETTVGPPATTSHVEVSEADRRALGIPEGLVRYSTGIEDVRDLIADLRQALEE